MEGLPYELSQVFFQVVGIQTILASNQEIRRLRRTLKKCKKIGGMRHDTCAVCFMILNPEERAQYCMDCNVGLPCATWKKEKHEGEPKIEQCIECDGFLCADCYNEESGMCEECD